MDNMKFSRFYNWIKYFKRIFKKVIYSIPEETLFYRVNVY